MTFDFDGTLTLRPWAWHCLWHREGHVSRVQGTSPIRQAHFDDDQSLAWNIPRRPGRPREEWTRHHFATARRIAQQKDTTVEELLRSRAEWFKAVRFHFGMDWAWMETLQRWNARDWFTEMLIWRLNMPEPEQDLEWE